MKINEKWAIWVVLLLFPVTSLAQDLNTIAKDQNTIAGEQKIKVACIGNSITFGAGIKDRAANSYPVVLGKLLGNAYEVRNFGFSGRTLMNKGDRPYMKEQMYRDALGYQPDIVVIKLGTNDSKSPNWVHHKDFPKDMQHMINDLLELPSKPKIYLCYPPKAYQSGQSINDSIIVNGVIPYIDRVAKKNKLLVIDLHTATNGMPQNFPDRIHPNEEGAVAIAEAVFKAISSGRSK